MYITINVEAFFSQYKFVIKILKLLFICKHILSFDIPSLCFVNMAA